MKNQHSEIEKFNRAHKTALSIITNDVDSLPACDLEDLEKLAQRLSDEQSLLLKSNKIKSLDKNRDSKMLTSEIRRFKAQRRQKRRIATLSSVAAALMVISFFIWKNDSQPTPQTLKTETMKAFTPMLITENGESIDLNKLSETIIAEDCEIEKIDSRTLFYKGSDRTAITKQSYNTLIVPAQYSYTILLADSTEVMLNAGSSLKYPTKFDNQNRCVELTGEGYFKVKKLSKPFEVKVNNMYVRVYGTEFNINSYKKDRIETVLIEGSIGISTKSMKELKMVPNQLFVYNETDASGELEEVEVTDYTHWINNNFKYNEREFKAVINDLKNWYGVDFKLNCNIDDLKITLFSPRDTPINEIFKFIELLTDVKFIKEGANDYSINR